MDCVNHAGKPATAYCQNCGKPLCLDCISSGVLRPASRGMILCNSCIDAWQATHPFVAPPPGTPSPGLAAFIGLIPGVGAMYNGQFVKGLIHVVIFAVLVSAAHLYDIFGLFIAAWIVYQSFEAYHTARARRDGSPLPDPLGLNEVGNWINPRSHQNGAPPNQPFGQPFGQPFSQTPPPPSQPDPATYAQQAGYQAPFTPYPPPPEAPSAPHFGAAAQPPVDPAAPTVPAGAIPPIPPVPPYGCYARHTPIGAIVLIVLGVMFLLGQLDIFSSMMFKYSWPVLLIGLGIWLFIRRLGDHQGGSR
ncbi:B-box zinc finger protein [Telmatobacter bradus]|uniref:B-box zinc finger protein n=1 Tax=Telmatobacter bradus TaxID=474953 RepID=UPI003B42BFD8